jgi:O-antigen ligase
MGGFAHAHNAYLQQAVDYGVPGLAAQLALMLGIAACLVTATRRRPEGARRLSQHSLAIGLFGSLIALAVHGLVEAYQVAPRGYMLAFAVFGLAAALSNHLLAETDSVDG